MSRPDFEHLASLPPCEGDLRRAARMWEKAQGDNVRLIGFSQPRPVGQDGEFICYATCGRHDACKGRYKFARLPGEPGRVLYRWHCAEAAHTLGDRIARKGAEEPVARYILQEAKAKALASNKRPSEINAELTR